MKRFEERFFGIHFDFHARGDETAIGSRTTPEMIRQIIDMTEPDFLQCDAKGHPGFSSYPTQAGVAAPNLVGDPLRVWREVTKERGVGLFVHFSGVKDHEAVRRHPEWARVNEQGEPDSENTSTFGAYANDCLIPQLRELADRYGLDGIWLDGECWAAFPDYGAGAESAFRKATGRNELPRSPSDPGYEAFMALCREQFRRYLRHYVDEVHRTAPGFRIASNWAFSSFMPEPVTAEVDFLSGDYTPHNSVNTASLEARCLAHQGKPWDLMAWGFGGRHGDFTNKSAVQLMQEAAVVLSLGGGFQLYYPQNRDGSVNMWEMEAAARVSRFCRERRPWCFRSEPIPQVALLYSTEAYYKMSKRLFSHWDGQLDPMRGVLRCLLDCQYSVDIVMTHHAEAEGRLDRYRLVVVPEWTRLETALRERLLAYASGGGHVLVIGAQAAGLFERELGVELVGPPERGKRKYVAHGGTMSALKTDFQRVRTAGATPVGRLHETKDAETKADVPATVTAYGAGRLAAIYFNLGVRYNTAASAVLRDFVGHVAGLLFPDPLVRVTGSRCVDVVASRNRGCLVVHLINTSGFHSNENVYDFDEIPPIGPLEIAIRTERQPEAVTMEPGGRAVPFAFADGQVTLTVPRLDIYEMLVLHPST